MGVQVLFLGNAANSSSSLQSFLWVWYFSVNKSICNINEGHLVRLPFIFFRCVCLFIKTLLAACHCLRHVISSLSRDSVQVEPSMASILEASQVTARMESLRRSTHHLLPPVSRCQPTMPVVHNLEVPCLYFPSVHMFRCGYVLLACKMLSFSVSRCISIPGHAVPAPSAAGLCGPQSFHLSAWCVWVHVTTL